MELKKAGYQWKQTEWIGWYNEWKARRVVSDALGGCVGPRYGRTEFDYRRECVWDFKVHPTSTRPWIILNDQKAIDLCIRDHGAIGFVVTLGAADYDDVVGSFKRWHDELKGDVSQYEQERIARGAASRRRKVRFQVNGFLAFVFEGPSVTRDGLDSGWLKKFQEGMRNAGGSPRRPKYMINVKRIPRDILVAPESA